MIWLALLTACGGESSESCDLAISASEVAGEGATDCGTIPEGDAGAAQWQCAIDAFEAGTPFYVRWSAAGIDSHLGYALVSDATRSWRFMTDDYGGGTEIDGVECVDPVVSEASGTRILECTSTVPQGNHYQVCGEICGPEACQPQPLPFPG